ncbi:hypothetical protein LSH36_1190g00093, partial [Paralvinella palmiformis]
KMSLKEYLSEVSGAVYVVVMFFAISAWIDINGLFVEVPLFVNVLPEGWSLFSYLAVIIQVANVGPILYTVLKKLLPGRIKEWPTVYIIVGIGATACFLLAFFWQETTVINGQPHSTALFVLVSFLALVDCTSSVVYLPYMGRYKPQYVTAYYIGEGLSGMIPGFVGLIQGVESEPECLNQTVFVINETTGENVTDYKIVAEYPPPLFSVQVFFFFLFGMMLVSGTAFSILNFHPRCIKERLASDQCYGISAPNLDTSREKQTGADRYTTFGSKELSSIKEASNSSINNLASSEVILTRRLSVDSNSRVDKHQLTKTQFIGILVMIGWLSALLNGVLPSTQSYTCLPYGSLAFTLAVRLSSVASPLMSFLALFMGTKSLAVVGVVSLIATGLSGWHLYLAGVSPYPPLKDTVAGTTLVVRIWALIITQIISSGSIAYAKVCSASILNERGKPGSLLWFGGATQIGSCVGAVVIFIFVNVLEVFKSEPPCPGMEY